MDRVAEVVAFRERLVAYMNLVLGNRPNESIEDDTDAGVVTRIRSEQVWLSQTYGRLYKVINPSGIPPRMAIGYGTILTSPDVIADVIHKPGGSDYADLARLADQHLTMRIGQMQAEGIGPDTLYRLTSPVYWLGRLWALIRWLVTTKGGRIVAIVGALLAIVIGAFVNVWAQSLFPR